MESSIEFINIYPAVTQCFGVILCGYISCRLNIITNADSKGLGLFVGKFALPSLIFLSMAKLDFSNVNWYFLLSIFLSKLVVFSLVVVGTIILSRNKKLGKAGLFGIFCTQSNDFALGYPIIDALYSKSQPMFVSYLYLIAPITFLILNPIGFFLLESQKKLDGLVSTNHLEETQVTVSKSCMSLLQKTLVNPNVLMTIFGIMANFIFHHDIPLIIGNVFEVFSNAFSASALFLLGIHMVGHFRNITGLLVLVPCILICLKSLFLPLITRQICSSIISSNSTNDFADFGFLYGTFPSAPGAFVYSLDFNIESSLLASTMVLNTFLSAPLIIISAKMISLSTILPEDYASILKEFSRDSYIISSLLCVWVLIMCVITSKFKKIVQQIILHLCFIQLLLSIGVIMWSTVSLTEKSWLYMTFLIYSLARSMLKCANAVLLILLIMILYRGVCLALRCKKALIYFIYGLPIIMTAIMAPWIFYSNGEFNLIPDFSFGRPFIVLNIVFDFIFSIFISCALILLVRKYKMSKLDSIHHIQENNESNAVEVSDIEDLVSNYCHAPSVLQSVSCSQHLCGSSQSCEGINRQSCQLIVLQYYETLTSEFDDDSMQLPISFEKEHDMTKIITITVFILINTIVTLSVNIWYVVTGNYRGLFAELVFLSGTLSSALSVILLISFGVECKTLIYKCQQFYRKISKGSDLVEPLDWSALSQEQKQHCLQFFKYHLEKCKVDICFNLIHYQSNYSDVFRGENLVTWLLERGLAQDYQQGMMYGEELLDAGIIEHIRKKQYFQKKYHYRFRNINIGDNLLFNEDPED